MSLNLMHSGMSEDGGGKPSPNQCDGECDEGGVDRISQLPDDIIVHILSFLPLKKAVVTSILSSRWLDLWKYRPSIELTGQMINDINFAIVTSVVNSYKAPSLKEFSISFLPFGLTQSKLTKWLKFAFSRRVERLNLDFQVPNEVDAADFNKILRVSKIPACDFKSLKELKLVYWKVGGEAIKLLLRNCKLLEKLTIIGWLELESDVEIFGKLKHLEISARDNPNSVRISSAPNLSWLSIRHPSERVSIENVPKLVTMDLTWQHSDTMHNFASVAAHLETLTITLYQPMSMSLWVPKMPRLKKLTLQYRESTEMRALLQPITRWIWASPHLQEFKLETMRLIIQKDMFEVPGDGKFRHLHLKVFEFSGFVYDLHDHRGLVKYIVENCVELQKMKIVPFYPYRGRYGYYSITEEQGVYWSKLKRYTKKLLARTVPHHIQVHVA